jgi:hypothetical protein
VDWAEVTEIATCVLAVGLLGAEWTRGQVFLVAHGAAKKDLTPVGAFDLRRELGEPAAR